MGRGGTGASMKLDGVLLEFFFFERGKEGGIIVEENIERFK